MIKQLIIEDLKKTIKSLGFVPTDIVLSIPENSQFGDYTTNIALQLSKQEHKNNYHSPQEIAKAILDKFGLPQYLTQIEIAGPGFINFFVNLQVLAEELTDIIHEKEFFGHNQKHSGKKARVEFVSANPTGPLHIGNARGGPLGDVIATLLESQGYEVLREYYHNDVGNQVAQLGKTVAYKAGLVKDIKEEELVYKGEYINELAEQVRAELQIQLSNDDIEQMSNDQIANICGHQAVEILLTEILKDCEDFGIKYNLVVYESQIKTQVPEVIKELQQRGKIKSNEGALWFAPSDEFLKDRETVVQKSNGEYTYFASDIVYHKQKFESNSDVIVNVLGSGHHGHIPRLLAVISALGYDTSKITFPLFQNVRVKKGNDIVKMSKRAGNFVTAREVLDEVGKDAFRFMLLHTSANTHLDFDVDLAKDKSNKNPVFYVQYAYARMSSVLSKADHISQDIDHSKLIDPAELTLIKHLLEFPSTVEEISKSFEVHKLTFYSLKLAELFHHFYEQCPVLHVSDPALQQARLNLVYASKIVLGNSLDLLGITAPEKM